MNVVPIADGALPVLPDIDAPRTASDVPGASEFMKVLGDIDGALERAAGAEADFVNGSGSLADMVIDRARADVALSLAAAGASHVTQAVTSVLGMQV